MTELKGKTVVVVGGAAGLGAAVVTRLDQLGATAIIADTRRDAADSVMEDLDGEHSFTRMDMSDEASVKAGFAKFAKGDVHHVVVTAGIYPNMPFFEGDAKHRLDTMIRALHVNVIGAFLVAREAAPVLKANAADDRGGRGTITFATGITSSSGHLALAACDGGVQGMVPVLAEELAGEGIRVNAIATAFLQTRMLKQAQTPLTDQQQRAVFPTLPGKSADFALMAEQVMLNPMLNGQILQLSAGLR